MVSEVSYVISVARDSQHNFSKSPCKRIEIIAGLGVSGDAHLGKKVQHLSRVRADPEQPNLRQVHLIHSELFDELAVKGFNLNPGDLGENITTRGIDLLTLGRGTLLKIGQNSVLEVTGLRNPCAQIEAFMPGLLKEVAVKTSEGLVRKTGIMTIARKGGIVSAGDAIQIVPPEGPHIPLERV